LRIETKPTTDATKSASTTNIDEGESKENGSQPDDINLHGRRNKLSPLLYAKKIIWNIFGRYLYRMYVGKALELNELLLTFLLCPSLTIGNSIYLALHLHLLHSPNPKPCLFWSLLRMSPLKHCINKPLRNYRTVPLLRLR